ncbi:uncharacterized protein LOC126687954 [Mercurialis annua]|uniref:uncharacterized protein LOC126687954 n=1 Tax=Mercurialis annua TaxID=3986 RepID=UPI00215EA586|nr:uncharacterized protein LOC126687954 [Mercurialis annua]
MTISRVFQLKPLPLTLNSKQRLSISSPSLLQIPIRRCSSRISTKPGQLLVSSSNPVSHIIRHAKDMVKKRVVFVNFAVMELFLALLATQKPAPQPLPPGLSQASSLALASHYERLELSKTCFRAAFLIIVGIASLADKSESNDREDKRTRLQIGLRGAKDMVKQNQTKPPTVWIVECIVVALLLGAIAPRGNIIAQPLSQTSSSMWSQLDSQSKRVELANYGFQAVVLIMLGKIHLQDYLKSNGREDKRTSVVKLQIGLRGALQSLRQDLDIIRSSNNDSIFKIRGKASERIMQLFSKT